VHVQQLHSLIAIVHVQQLHSLMKYMIPSTDYLFLYSCVHAGQRRHVMMILQPAVRVYFTDYYVCDICSPTFAPYIQTDSQLIDSLITHYYI
jgi:hypothetical protein